jgi:luciferase family oxidoreductase group 1
LSLWRGEYLPANRARIHAHPAEGADLAVWVLGSSAGESARVAGEHGLPFTANYHQFPASVLETVAAYRDAFQPSQALAEPYVMVSVDALAADTDERARWLAAPTALCVLNIRRGLGYLPYPTPEVAAERPLTEEERELVADRLKAQIVGDPATVVQRLEALRQLTGADELLILTVANRHADRVRSYELVADAWRRR